MSKEMWAVGPVEFEYNDEIYSGNCYGSQPIIPQVVFSDTESANDWAMEQNIKMMREVCISEYCYDSDDINVDQEFWQETFGKDAAWDDYEINVPKDATDDQVARLVKRCSIKFYVVYKVKCLD